MTLEEMFENRLLSLGNRLRTMQRIMRDNSWQFIVPLLNDAIGDQKVLEDLWPQMPKQAESEADQCPSK